MACAPWGFVSRRMFVLGGGGVELPPCTHRLGCAKLSCWTGGSYSPSGCRHTEETKNWHLVVVWLAFCTPHAETNRVAALHRLRSLVTVVWEVSESTSPQPRTVPRHICRHSPINETNGRLLTGTPPRLGMTYVVLEGAYLCSMRLCADCDGEQK